MALFGKKKKKNQPKKTHKTAPDTVQRSIPYTTLFPDGTIETKPGTYTRAYNLEDINFKIAPDEEQVSIFRSYGDFLNSFTQHNPFQIIIQNRAADKRRSLEDIRFLLQRDGLNKYRQEMNGILLDKLTAGNKSLKQDKYLVVNTEAESLEKAMTDLDNIDREIKIGLKRISKDVIAQQLPIEERLQSLFDVYNQDGKSVFYNDFKKDGITPYFNFEKLGRAGVTSKDIIGPPGMEFKSNYFTLGDTFGKALYLEGVPNWLSTEFISDLSDAPCSLLISINHMPIKTEKAIRMIKNQMMSINGQIAENQKKAI